MTDLVKVKSEMELQLADKAVFAELMRITFNNLPADVARRAALEGALRGYTIKSFLDKDVYAIPFRGNYALVNSIGYARKIGEASGVSGKSEPRYIEENGKIITCSVTVYKKDGDERGFTAIVYFNEYVKPPTIKNGEKIDGNWQKMPHTMIAKVAEMHALRMACPSALSDVYVEEEREQKDNAIEVTVNVDEYKTKLLAAKDEADFKVIWSGIPVLAKKELEEFKNEMKAKYAASQSVAATVDGVKQKYEN